MDDGCVNKVCWSHESGLLPFQKRRKCLSFPSECAGWIDKHNTQKWFQQSHSGDQSLKVKWTNTFHSEELIIIIDTLLWDQDVENKAQWCCNRVWGDGFFFQLDKSTNLAGIGVPTALPDEHEFWRPSTCSSPPYIHFLLTRIAISDDFCILLLNRQTYCWLSSDGCTTLHHHHLWSTHHFLLRMPMLPNTHEQVQYSPNNDSSCRMLHKVVQTVILKFAFSARNWWCRLHWRAKWVMGTDTMES